MILHLGDDQAVWARHVLAILAVDTVRNADTRAFLQRARTEGHVVPVGVDPPKSAVVTIDDQGVRRVYLSPISPATLRLRSASPRA